MAEIEKKRNVTLLIEEDKHVAEKKILEKKEKEKVCEKNRGETGGNESLVEQAERS